MPKELTKLEIQCLAPAAYDIFKNIMPRSMYPARRFMSPTAATSVKSENRHFPMYRDGKASLSSASYNSTALAADPSLEVSYLVAPPRMAYYEKVSRQIYGIYLKYIAPEDIVVYSIDEVFIDATSYLSHYNMTAHDLAMTMIREVLYTTGIIIFASGIYFSQFEKRVMAFVEKNLPAGKKTAVLYTYGAKRDSYTNKITEAIQQKGSTVIGSYGCLGFDTFGPFKLFGGIAKGHPSTDEIASAVKFVKGLA